MILNDASFTTASTLIHAAQGAALLALGAVEAYSVDNQVKKLAFAGPLFLLLAAAAVPLAVLALPGGWSLELARTALDARRGFYLFVALACFFGAAGLSRITQVSTGAKGGGWHAAFLAFLAVSGVIYFMLPWRVNEDAWRPVFIWHAAIGSTLLLAVAFKAAHAFSGRRALQTAWAVLLMVTALQLVTYKELENSFSLKMVTLASAPPLPAAKAVPAGKAAATKHAGPADKKRSRN